MRNEKSWRTCLECGTNVYKSVNGKYCSDLCGFRYRRKHGTTIRPGPANYSEVQCAICLGRFYPTKYEALRGARYCSATCAHQGQPATRLAKLRFVPKKEFTCRYCGTDNWCMPRQIRKYCDQKCYWAHRGRRV